VKELFNRASETAEEDEKTTADNEEEEERDSNFVPEIVMFGCSFIVSSLSEKQLEAKEREETELLERVKLPESIKNNGTIPPSFEVRGDPSGNLKEQNENVKFPDNSSNTLE
jgi:hypothetical protein